MSRINQLPSLLLLVCLIGFPQISETIYTPSLPDLAHGLGVQMDLAELTLSIYFIGFAVGVLIFGILADLMGRRQSMLFGILIYVLGSLGCSVAVSIHGLLLCRLIQAFGASAGSVVTQTMLRDLYTGAERSRVFSIVSGALAFSPALGPVIGGLINQLFRWRANFYVLVALGLVLGVWSVFQLHETQLESARGKRINGNSFLGLCQEMMCDLALIRNAILIAICNGVIFSYYAEAPFLFIEILQLKPIQYGFLGLVIASSFVCASFVSLKLNARYSIDRTISIGSVISCLGAVLLSVMCGLIDRVQQDFSILNGVGLIWIGLIISIVLIFLGVGVIIPNCLSHALVRYQTRSGTAGSIFGFTYYWMIAGLTALMSLIHNGSALAMPLYFCALTGGMWILSIYAPKAVLNTVKE